MSRRRDPLTLSPGIAGNRGRARRGDFAGNLRGWAFIAPALLWTSAFFILPFLAMALVSLSFSTSYVVRSYSWLLARSEKGVINNPLVSLGRIAAPVQLANARFA